MFKTRTRKIRGDVTARKGRTALVSIAIFIGVAGTIAFFSLSDIIVRQLREDIKEDELSMVDIFLSADSDAALDDEAYIEQLSQVEGVTEIQGYAQGTGYYKLSEDAEDFDQAVLVGYTVPFAEMLMEPLRLIEGDYPAEGQNQVALEQRTAESLLIGVGDTLIFRILSPSKDATQAGEIGTLETWTVSGIVFDAYQGTNQRMYASPTNVNYVSGLIGLSAFEARFVDFPTAEAQQEAFSNLIANETAYRPVFTLVQNPAENQQIQGAQTIGNTMGFLAIVALVVSGFLVINVISSIVVEQKRLIGVMKSMGATRWDNFVMYCGIAFSYGVIGVTPGVIVGILGGNAAAQALAPTLGTVLDGFQISTSSIIIGVIVGLLIPVLAAVLPVFLGTQVKILDAITDLGIDAKYGTGPLAKLISALPIPITIRQGLSNVSIKKSRLAFTVITLSIAAGAFMGIFAVFNSLTSGIGTFIDTFNVEIGLVPNQGRDPEQINAIISDNFQTADNNLIGAIEPGFQYQVEFEGYEPVLAAGGPPGIFAYGYDINSATPAFNFTVDVGDPLTDANGSNGIILAQTLATKMGKNVGDSVVLKVPGNTKELIIVGLSNYPFDQVWMDWRVLAEVTGYTIVPELTSPIPVPAEAANFLRYASLVNAAKEGGAAAEAAAFGFTREAATLFANFIEDGGAIFTPDEPTVVISRALAESGGYAVGDTLQLASAQPDGATETFTVTGILDLPAQMQSDALPAELIGLDWQQLATLDGQNLDGERVPQPQAYFLTTTLENPTTAQLDDIIDALNEDFLSAGIPVQTINFVAQVDLLTNFFTIIQVVLQLVAGLIALVGALGLLTTLSMSVFERQKEIGVMRSIGASSGTVATQFLTEGMVVGIIAWLVGLPIAVAIQYMLLTVTQFIETFPPVYPVQAALLGLVGMIVITIIASLWPSLSAARKTVSDILRYQ